MAAAWDANARGAAPAASGWGYAHVVEDAQEYMKLVGPPPVFEAPEASVLELVGVFELEAPEAGVRVGEGVSELVGVFELDTCTV